jgi:hypothetical protein
LGPIVDGLEKNYGDKVEFLRFYPDVPEQRKIYEQLKIRRVPVLHFIDRKMSVVYYSGADKSRIEQELQKIINSKKSW